MRMEPLNHVVADPLSQRSPKEAASTVARVPEYSTSSTRRNPDPGKEHAPVMRLPVELLPRG